MSVTCLVPVHNHWKVTARCLASIINGDPPEGYKIIVIDDASTDATPALVETIIKQGYPVKYIRNEENLGFLGSLNKGLKYVDTKYILFTNNDIYVDKGCLKKLIEVYEKYPDIGIVGATQLDMNRNELAPLTYFARGEKAVTIHHIISTNIPKELKDAEVIYCDVAHFPCALFSKEIYDKIGPLDPIYGKGNYEQEDYCLRIKELGKQVAICPKATFIHYVSVSVKEYYSFYEQLLNENRRIFLSRWGQKLKENKI